MNRVIYVLLVILVVIGVIALVAVLTGSAFAARPLPRANGIVTLNGLQDSVVVRRDDYGVPHIYALNEADLYFAQGYVHAQDRFWQMDFWRHVGQGRIAEIAGAPAVDSDKFIRTMGWHVIAADIVEYYRTEAPEFYAVLEAYSAGVNAYLAEKGEELPLQHVILGAVQSPWEVAPWQPVNTVSWGVVMSDQLAGSYDLELRNAILQRDLGVETAETLVPPYDFGFRPVVAPTQDLVNGAQVTAPQAIATAVDWHNVNFNLVGTRPAVGLGSGPAVGSNNWVISGEHTASGLPLLANDPHLGVQMPSIWYEVGLHAPDLDVVGFSFAGVPGVIIGHNADIAWGVTTSAPDVQDLYVERINPDNPLQYELDGQWQDMTVREEIIKVNGGEDVALTVYESGRGPIVTDIITSPEDGLQDQFSVEWAARERPSRILQSVVLLNRASNWGEFYEAMRYWDIPSQNVVYADTDGNIGYIMPGQIPIRKQGDGTLPTPGWSSDYGWEGWIPHEELPTMFNPAVGYIVTANNAVVEPDFPHLLTGTWYNDGDRAQRIHDMVEEILASGEPFTPEHMAAMQNDSGSLPAATYVPLLTQLISDDTQVQDAINRLQGWDYQERRDSVPAALFELFYLYLFDNVLGDDLSPENLERARNNPFMYDIAGQPDAVWWDDQTTPDVETRDDMLLKSLRDALDWFATNQGGSVDDWTWGSIHTVTFADGVLGASGVGPIEAIFNRGPYAADGGNGIVLANSWDVSDPARIDWHPSMRMIIDLSDMEAGQSVHPTGQSGHPHSPHYDDMLPLWLNGKYHPMLFGREAVEEGTANMLVLEPAP